MDDYATIVENASLRRWSDFWSVISPTAHLPTGGRPLANLTFALNYAWGGTNVIGYHIVNLAIHLGAALLLFGVVRRTAERRLPGAAHVIASIVAATWALHPVQTASVTYLSQRTESLMGLCYLATIYAFIRGAQDKRHGWMIVSVITCALGMTAKETMATAPVVVLLYDRTFIAGTIASALRQRTLYYTFAGLTWLFLVGNLFAGTFDRGVGFELGVSSWHYALTQTKALLLYLKLGIWPHPLVFDYGPAFLKTLSTALPFAVPLLALLAATGFALRRAPPVGFCAATFFLLLAPTSSFVPIALQPLAENRVYLPLAPLLALATLAAYRFLGARLNVVAGCIALACLALTALRNQDYRLIPFSGPTRSQSAPKIRAPTTIAGSHSATRAGPPRQFPI